MRRALLLINPNSRRGDGDIAPTLEVLEKGGLQLIRPPDDRAADMAGTIAEHGPECDLVIVGGGDGTANAAIDALLDLEKPLGLLPLGTANDLARTLDLPSEPEDAARVILEGKTRRIDIGRANDKHFFNVASLGLSGDVTDKLDADLKARFGVLGYPMSLWQATRQRRAFRVEISCDGETLSTRAIQISVGNGRYYGGGMAIAADASIDDGIFDLVLMAPQPMWSLIGKLPIFRWGRHDLNESVVHLHGREIHLTTTENMPINTDGEITTATPAIFQILPKALEIFVP